jgi:hypothetical protein
MRRIRGKLTYANLVATLALFIAGEGVSDELSHRALPNE